LNLESWLEGTLLFTLDQDIFEMPITELDQAVIRVTTVGAQGLPGAPGDLLSGIATKTAAAATSFPLAQQFVRTSGYSIAGRGAGLYKREASEPSIPSRAKFLSAAPNAAWWSLVPEGGVVNIEQLGGVADFNGTTGTDNYPILTEALAWEAHREGAQAYYTYIINFGPGRYYFSQGFDIHATAYIRGAGRHISWNFATQLFFPSGTKHPFIIGHSTSYGWNAVGALRDSGESTTLEGFSIGYVSTAALDRDAAAVLARARVNLRDVGVKGAHGHGFRIRAQQVTGDSTLKGDANQWNMYNCMVYSCLGDSLRVEGNDANAGTCVNFVNQSGVGGCGIIDESGLGNCYVGGHISGYNNTGVSHGGGLYVLISPVDGQGSITTPGTNNAIWYRIGDGSASGQFPAWSGANTYYIGLEIYSSGSGTTFSHMYVEGGTAGRHLIKNGGIGLNVGGAAVVGSNVIHGAGGPNVGGLVARGGAGAYYTFEPGELGRTENGESVYAAVGRPGVGTTADGLGGTNGGLSILEHHRALDGGRYRYGYRDRNLVYVRENGRPIWEITTIGNTEEFGRGVAQGADHLKLFEPVLVDPNETSVARSIGIVDTMPGAGSGPHAQGEVRFNSGAVAGGFVGWVCVASGDPGTWKTFGAISA
jgi:hypothetical protein